MSVRRFHRSIGLIMLLPMIGWAITGLVFFIKPGYQGAYEIPLVKTYPLEQSFAINSDFDWLEMRLMRTVLGYHLLVTTDAGSQHINPVTLEEIPLPPPEQMQRLFADAVSSNAERYGEIERVTGNTAETSTGVTLVLDWQRLKLSQRGRDTELIDLLYEIHYLRWTPWDAVNQVLGLAGLFFLVTLSLLGMRIYFASPIRSNKKPGNRQ